MLGPRRPTTHADRQIGADRRELAAIFAGGAVGGGIRTLAVRALAHSCRALAMGHVRRQSRSAASCSDTSSRVCRSGFRSPRMGGRCSAPVSVRRAHDVLDVPARVAADARARQRGAGGAVCGRSVAAGFVGVALGTAIVRRGEAHVVITVLLVVVCGGIGSIARFRSTDSCNRAGWASSRSGRSSSTSGVVLARLARRAAPAADAMLVLETATIGSYTTFSTWMLETHRLAEDGEPASRAKTCDQTWRPAWSRSRGQGWSAAAMNKPESS